MKKQMYVILGAMTLFFVVGCQTAQNNKAVQGGVIGGLLGATAGGIIGHQSGHGGEGAAIGAAAGIVGGALVGSQMNNHNTQSGAGTAGQKNTASNPQQIPVQQIIAYSQQGVNEYVIIDKIRLSNSRYTLTPEDVSELKKQGVHANVIAVMQGN